MKRAKTSALRMVPVLFVLLATGTSAAAAQVAWEIRGGGAIGNHTDAAAGLEVNPGPSFSTFLLVGPFARTSLYMSYSRSSFGCEEGFCIDRDVKITSRGWGGGIRLAPIDWVWVQAGVSRLGTTVDTNSESMRIDPVFAYEGGAGISLPLLSWVRLSPGVAYRSSIERDGRTTVLVAELGVTALFGR